MSGKLDQSLDAIMKDRKPAGGKRGGRAGRPPARKAATATTAAVAPTGGIQKKSKGKGPKMPAMTPPTGESKISVSNLPEDVTESMIKEYFGNRVSPVKRVILNYGPNGRSRGSATIMFGNPTAAQEAVKLNGIKVDGKPLRVEILLGAGNVAPSGSKPLQDRISKPKNAAQEAQKKKEAPARAATNGAGKGGRGGQKKSGRAGKPKAKTAAELDAEMSDYFGGAATTATTNGVETGMEMDQVL